MARRNWTPIPETVLKGSAQAELVLALPLSTRGVYLSMWIIADSHGRFSAGERSLRAELGIFEADMQKHLARLDGLVTLYRADCGLTAELVHSDCGLPAELVRRRGKSNFPGPDAEGSEIIATAELVQTTPQSVHGQSGSVQVTEKRREEKRRGETYKSPPSRARMEPNEDEESRRRVAHLRGEDLPVQPWETHPPILDERGQAVMDELAKRSRERNWSMGGRHAGGFFAEDGHSDFEMRLRRLMGANEIAYADVCRGFWPHIDKTEPHKYPYKPAKALEKFLVRFGHVEPVIFRAMRVTASGGAETNFRSKGERVGEHLPSADLTGGDSTGESDA